MSTPGPVTIPEWWAADITFQSKYINSGKNICLLKSFDFDTNIAVVKIDNTEGSSWVEDDWNLIHLLWGFEDKTYTKLL